MIIEKLPDNVIISCGELVGVDYLFKKKFPDNWIISCGEIIGRDYLFKEEKFYFPNWWW